MIETLSEAVAGGDSVALARAISLVEEGSPRGEALLGDLFPRTGRAAVVGITGPPGAGKSSLVNRLVTHYRARGRRIGVVAVDPTSAFSGGALLGDRIRMQEHALDPGVFIRSMATRGRFGGISRATRDAVDLIDASGRTPILIETVGVGQDEVDIVRAADTVVVVLTPGQGDDIQAIKAGLLEIADLFVINKADHEGADRLAADLEALLSLGDPWPWRPRIVRSVATEGRGVKEVAEAIEAHREHQGHDGRLETRRRAALSSRLLEIVRDRLLQEIRTQDLGPDLLARYEARLLARDLDPYAAAGEILARLPPVPGTRPVLDHLGVAVRDIEAHLPLYRDRLGLEVLAVEQVDAEGVRVAMIPAGRTRIELVQPISGSSTVTRFLERRGEGLHHICLEVDDLEATLGRLKEGGIPIAGAEGRAGAEGSRVAFLHPRGTGGILIELRQRAARSRVDGGSEGTPR
ncbi:MAG TPA: methylmalonyl Co-A mutase-associated GTPase MeaB [Candidatus Polarisedimenticolia bacterium]|nr:methylmalonyl Co-A mutase-associated GTPase MeaB [Candidatus Polarisedimenticolia bacterium]